MEDKAEVKKDEVKKDGIETRLKEATDHCLKAHAEWDKDQKNSATRGNLMDAVHDLRKVAARLEIEVAISERNEMTAKPIPIPSHRSNKRKPYDNGEDNRGNRPPSSGGYNKSSGGRPRRSGRTGSAPKTSG